MKIGIDAKWFYSGPPSGRVVVRNLIRHLVELSPEDDFYIFLDKQARGKEFPYLRPNVHLVYVWAGNNLLSNVFVVPFRSFKLHLDAFVLQNFSPVFFNFKRYVLIFDVIFRSHPEFFSLPERIYFWPIKYLAFFATRLCTISETEKKRMADFGYAKAPSIDVMYLGVDEVFKPREAHDADSMRLVAEKYGLPAKFILYVGRLNIRKNISNLLRALPRMKNGAVPLIIVGAHDWKTTDLESLIDELDIANRVIFTGHVSDDDLPRIVSLASVFCFVSYAEAFGLPALEAMASGVPVVTSDRTCLPEVCGDAALYADPDNPGQIAEKIDQLLDNHALWQEQRRLGIIRAQSFTWRATANTLKRNLSEIVTGA